jgi:hypothetical protein
MLRRNMPFGDLFQIKSATCPFGANSTECVIHHVHYLWECADNNPIILVQTACRLGRVRAGAAGWKMRNIFSHDVVEFRFWLNVVVGLIDGKGQRRHTGNVTKAMQIEPFRLVANFAPNKFDA